MNDTAQGSPAFPYRRMRNIVAVILVILILATLLLGAVPASIFKTVISEKLQGASDREVAIGSVSRDSFFSYTPVITVHDVRVAQPAWAGEGDFLKLKSISARVSVLDMLTGSARPDRL